MADPSQHEAHDIPLANRLAERAIADWLNTATGLALAGYGQRDASDLVARKAITELRHLHLDNYTYTLVPKLLDELKRAGMLRADGDGGA